jgi:hypothetical protein
MEELKRKAAQKYADLVPAESQQINKQQEKLRTVRNAIERIGQFVLNCPSADLDVSSPFSTIFAAYPDDIKEVCAIACCLPVSQVSVERIFSALRLIMTDYRHELKGETLDAVLFIRMNNLYEV